MAANNPDTCIFLNFTWKIRSHRFIQLFFEASSPMLMAMKTRPTWLSALLVAVLVLSPWQGVLHAAGKTMQGHGCCKHMSRAAVTDGLQQQSKAHDSRGCKHMQQQDAQVPAPMSQDCGNDCSQCGSCVSFSMLGVQFWQPALSISTSVSSSASIMSGVQPGIELRPPRLS
jgi:hypothetical protein